MKKILSIILVIATAFSFTACQVTPEEPIVVKKDMERLVEQAGAKEGGTKLSELGIPQGRYTFESTGLEGRLRIAVDADIQKPDTQSMPILRVSKGGFSQELVTAIFDYLFPGEKPYDISGRVQTKADIEKTLLYFKKCLADGSYATELGYQSEEEFRALIAQWEAQLAAAPETEPEITRSDGKMRLKMIENTGMFYVLDVSTSKGLSDSNDISNRFSVSTADPSDRMAITSGFGDHLYYGLYSASAALPNYTATIGRTDGTNLPDAAKKQLTVSFNEAKALCDSFFAAANLSKDYCFGAAFLVDDRMNGLADNMSPAPAEHYAYRLYYTRSVAGIPTFVNTDWSLRDSDFSIPWSYECVCFTVDHNGLYGISWHNPISVGETIQESTTLKPFEEIIGIFETMLKTKCEAATNLFFGEQGRMEIFVDRIQLSLVRIREQGNNAATGLLVPAWVFYGNNKATRSDGDVSYNFRGGEAGRVASASSMPKEPFPLLVINAIDGSIIDLNNGY